MAENTKIAWATHTFNPWIGCAKVHAGCTNCYAEAMAGRLGVQWGPNGTRRRTAESTWKQVEKWNRQAACNCLNNHLPSGGNPSTHWPSCPQADRPRVFPSLCDPFEDWRGPILGANGRPLYVPLCDDPHPNDPADHRQMTMGDVRRDFFALIDRTQNLDWLLLTKRPQNVRAMWPKDGLCPRIPNLHQRDRFAQKVQSHYRHNVHLLYSASDQETLESGLPHLLACRDLVPVLGLSLEPLIELVDLTKIQGIKRIWNALKNKGDEPTYWERSGGMLDWVIVGGESGPHTRPCNVEWIRSIVRQCKAAGVPCFVKQLGANVTWDGLSDCTTTWPDAVRQRITGHGRHWRVHLRDPKGGDLSEWPEDLRAQQFPIPK